MLSVTTLLHQTQTAGERTGAIVLHSRSSRCGACTMPSGVLLAGQSCTDAAACQLTACNRPSGFQAGHSGRFALTCQHGCRPALQALPASGSHSAARPPACRFLLHQAGCSTLPCPQLHPCPCAEPLPFQTRPPVPCLAAAALWHQQTADAAAAGLAHCQALWKPHAGSPSRDRRSSAFCGCGRHYRRRQAPACVPACRHRTAVRCRRNCTSSNPDSVQWRD